MVRAYQLPETEESKMDEPRTDQEALEREIDAAIDAITGGGQ
jgi:hypothetical protein